MIHMRSNLSRCVASFAVILFAGCSAKPTLREIGGMPLSPEFEGILTRIAARHNVQVLAKQPDGKYGVVHEQVVALPDQGRLFAVGIDANWLSDHKLVLGINPDGTLKKVDVTVTSKAESVLTQLGASAAGVANAVAALETKRQTALEEALKETEEDQAKLESLLLAYRTALENVFKAEASLMAPDLTPTDRAVIESDLRILKLKANQAARLLGRSPPYPEADELP